MKSKKEYKEEIEQLKKQIEDLQNESMGTSTLMSKVVMKKDAELRQLDKENKNLLEKLQACPSVEEHQKLKQQLKDTMESNTFMVQEIMNFRKKVEGIQGEKGELEEKIQALNSVIEDKDKIIKKKDDEKQDLQEDVEFYKREIERKKEELNKKTNQDASQFKLEKEQAEKTSKELLLYNQKIKDELRELQKKNDELEKKNFDLKVQIQRLNEEKKQWQNNLVASAAPQMTSKISQELQRKETPTPTPAPQSENKIAVPANNENQALEASLKEDEEYNEALTEILSDYLVKANANKFAVSVFDLFKAIIVNVSMFDDILEKTENLETLNELPVLLYEDINRFFLKNFAKIDELKLNDYLINTKLISQTNYDKSMIDLIKKVKILNNRNSKIFSLYKEKKDLFNKLAENNFDLIKNFVKNKILNKKDQSMVIHYQLVNKLVKLNKNVLVIDFRQIIRQMYTKTTNALIPYLIKERIGTVDTMKIYFNENNILDDLIFFIYFLKFYNNKLTSLTISFDGVDSKSPLVSYFQNNLSVIISILGNLKQLELKGIDIIPENFDSKELIKALVGSKIEKISLANCITRYSSFYFSEYLAKSQILTEFSCCENPEEGIIPTFIPYFKTLKNLVSLNLSGNKLSQIDFEDLSEFLQNESQLKEINFSCIQMSTENCNTLGLALRKVKGLESFNINNCKISEENFNLLINRATTKTLMKLYLDGNPFGDSGVTGLGAYLKENQVYHYLSLQNCGISLQGFSVLKIILNVCLAKNAEIHVEDNPLLETPEIVQLLGESSILESKGIKIFIKRRKFDPKTVDRLMNFKELTLV